MYIFCLDVEKYQTYLSYMMCRHKPCHVAAPSTLKSTNQPLTATQTKIQPQYRGNTLWHVYMSATKLVETWYTNKFHWCITSIDVSTFFSTKPWTKHKIHQSSRKTRTHTHTYTYMYLLYKYENKYIHISTYSVSKKNMYINVYVNIIYVLILYPAL